MKKLIKEYYCNDTYHDCRIYMERGEQWDRWSVEVCIGDKPWREVHSIRKNLKNKPDIRELQIAWVTKYLLD